MPDHEPTGPTPDEPTPTTESAETAATAATTVSESQTPTEPDPAEPTSAEPEIIEIDATAEVATSASTAPAAEQAGTSPGVSRAGGGGTRPVWWEWFGRHRLALLIGAGVLTVALVATFVGIAISAPGPEDVVEDYLDALQAGDTDAALEIVGKPKVGNRLDFVTTDAMADGWTVDSVVVHNLRDNSREDEADVDVTISTKNETAQGRFHVVERDGEWRIDTPFVKLDMTVVGLDTITLGGVTRKVQHTDPAGDVPLLLFPGAYRPDSTKSHVALSPGEFIATPQPSEEYPRSYTPTIELTDDGAQQAQRAIDAFIDDCAEKTDILPAGCPFSADDVVGSWTEVKTLAWRVTTHPEAVFEPNGAGGFALITRKPGIVELAGTGVEDEPPAKRFAATCEFSIGEQKYGYLGLDLSAPEVAVVPARDTSLVADLSTRCH
jgi:hypothetical protein